jgi:ABC-2 type transport system ATP-binding protein
MLMHGPIDSVYRKIRRNRIVEIRFLANQDAGVSILRSDPTLRGLDIDGDRATAELETDDEGLAKLLEQLVAGGVKMKSYSDKDPSLEDVFMLITKGLVA